jgi:hypothetical protein
MHHENNDIANLVAVLALILAMLGLIIAAVAPVLGALSGLVIAAFIGGGATGVWLDRQLRDRRNG